MYSQGASFNSAIRLQGGNSQLNLLNSLHKDNGNTTFTTYQAHQFDIETFETKLVNIVDTASSQMSSNCAILNLWDQLCKDDNSTCQLAEISIQSTENAMTLLAQGFYTLNGVCEMADFPATTEIIERCHKGL